VNFSPRPASGSRQPPIRTLNLTSLRCHLEAASAVAPDQATHQHHGCGSAGHPGLGPLGAAGEAEQQDAFENAQFGGNVRGQSRADATRMRLREIVILSMKTGLLEETPCARPKQSGVEPVSERLSGHGHGIAWRCPIGARPVPPHLGQTGGCLISGDATEFKTTIIPVPRQAAHSSSSALCFGFLGYIG
jgi:hypothetical protein